MRACLKAPRSQSSRIHRGIGRNDDVSAFRSPRLVLVLRRIIRVNHKTKIFRKNAQKHPSQICKLSSTANPSVCPPYLSNSRRWHALVNKTHLATQFRPRLLRQPVPLLSRGQVTVDPKRSRTGRQVWRFVSSWRFRCLLRARAETAQWRIPVFVQVRI